MINRPRLIFISSELGIITRAVLKKLDYNKDNEITFDELVYLDSDYDGFFEVDELVQFVIDHFPAQQKGVTLNLAIPVSDCEVLETSQGECEQLLRGLGEDTYHISIANTILQSPQSEFTEIVKELSAHSLYRYTFDGLPQSRDIRGTTRSAEGMLGRWHIYQGMMRVFGGQENWTRSQVQRLKDRYDVAGIKEVVKALDGLIKWSQFNCEESISTASISTALARILDVSETKIASLMSIVSKLPQVFSTFSLTGEVDLVQKADILRRAQAVDTVLHDHIDLTFRGLEGIRLRKNISRVDFLEQFVAVGKLLKGQLNKIGFNATFEISPTESIWKIPFILNLQVSFPSADQVATPRRVK